MSSRVARSRLVVLYIDSLKLGGAERITLTWASWLRDAGWSPVVLTRKPLSWDFYPVPDGVAREVEPTDPPWLRCLGVAGFPVRVWLLRRWLQRQQIAWRSALLPFPRPNFSLPPGD